MTPSSAARGLAASLLLVALAAPASARRTRTPAPKTRTPTPNPTAAPRPAPKPAALIPDPPYVGTPAAGEKPYVSILRAREAGATEGELLSTIAKDDVRYSLSTPEIQKLRAAGVSPKVIEAMLRSGRTPVAKPVASPGAPGAAVSPPAAGTTPARAASENHTPAPR